MTKLKVLRSRLSALSRRRWLVRVVTGFSGLCLAAVWVLLAAFVVDWLLELPRIYRAGSLAVIGVTLLWAFRRFVRPSLGQRESLIDMALFVEGRHKIDTDLVAALEFESPEADAWGSRELEDAVIDRVSDLSRGVNVFHGMDYATVLRRGTSLAALVVLIAAGAGLFPGHAAAFLDRLLLGHAHYPTRTQIVHVVINGQPVDLSPGKVTTVPCPYGHALEFRVHGAGELPETGTAKLWDLESRVESDLDLSPVTSGSAAGVGPKIGAAPSGRAASKEELIRRATLDLTGLPPTAEEVAAFVADDSPDAYEKLVDRLLASPAYGERFAKHWLDLARNSDDPKDSQFTLRDFIIRSLNSEKPGEGLPIAEMLAGDPPPPAPGGRVYAGRVAKLITSVGFQIHLGDAWTDPASVRVVPLPRVDVVLRVTPPAYTAAGDESLETPEGQRQVAVIENSRVDVLLRSNKPLASAKLVVKNQEYALVRDASDSTGHVGESLRDSPSRLGETRPRAATAERDAWTIAGDSPLARVTEPMQYVIHVQDQDGLTLEKPIEGYIRLRADNPPKAFADVRTKHVLKSAVANVFYGASDDYGLAELKLKVRVLRTGQNESPAKEFKLPLAEGTADATDPGQAHPRRVSSMLFQLARSFEQTLPQTSPAAPPRELVDEFAQRHVTLSAAATIPFARPGGGRWMIADPTHGLDFEIRHEAPKLNVYRIYPLRLNEFDLQVGDQVRIELAATDFRGESPGKSGVSEALILTVTDESGFLAASAETDQRSAEQLDAIIRLGLGDSP